jgi:hypothetical protein
MLNNEGSVDGNIRDQLEQQVQNEDDRQAQRIQEMMIQMRDQHREMRD